MDANVNSKMRVRAKYSDDSSVQVENILSSKISHLIRRIAGNYLNVKRDSSRMKIFSHNITPSNWSGQINKSMIDVVNLHWVAGETMSIEDIGRIKKPIVWTLHDMWPFCGAEHYTSEASDARWRNAYSKDSFTRISKGFDFDRLVWLRKLKSWKTQMHIVSPSEWLAECARKSSLFDGWPISVIPNFLDTTVFKPLDKEYCRRVLNLPLEKNIILFGAIGGGKDPRKGYKQLMQALEIVANRIDTKNLMCVIFGQTQPEVIPHLPLQTVWVGHLNDDVSLALLYNSATLMVVPSIQENLPQTATEAQACGIPVVAFNCTGMPDAVKHLSSGYLAQAYDASDLAYGIIKIIDDTSFRGEASLAARCMAEANWSREAIVLKYIKVYESAIKTHAALR